MAYTVGVYVLLIIGDNACGLITRLLSPAERAEEQQPRHGALADGQAAGLPHAARLPGGLRRTQQVDPGRERGDAARHGCAWACG